jgi:SAM-dependent methyltransferase
MSSKSLFRKYQNNTIKKFAEDCNCATVVEWGGVESDGHWKYFPNHINFHLTNIENDDNALVEDLTALSHATNSVECALCISVLQHVFELDKAIAEIIRVLKPGGKCLITNGYIFPVCMEEDYYRLTPAFWHKRLENEPVEFEVIQLGNMYDALDNLLMRPYGKYIGTKNIIHKFLSLPFKLLRHLAKKKDSSPLGVAVIIKKTESVD